MYLYWINLTFACAGVLTNQGGIIKDSAPIFRKWIGQDIQKLLLYYKRKGRFIEAKRLKIGK